MFGLLNRRTASHQSFCGVLAALMAGAPGTSIAQPLEVQPKSAEAPPVDAPRPQPRQVANDKTLLGRAGATEPVEVSYILPNACIAVAIRPAQILNAPIAEMFPTEVLQAAALSETGLDPLAAEQVVVSLAPPLGGPPSYTVFARFKEATELKINKLTEHTEQATVRGKPYLRSPDLMKPSFYSIDDKSLLAAPDFTLLQFVNREEPPQVGPLAASLAAAAKNDDLLALVDIANLRPLINMGVAQANLPPELAFLREIPDLVQLLEFRVNISQAAPSELIATANSEADAERLVTLFNDAKGLVADKMTEEASRALAKDDPVEQAGGLYTLRMAKLFEKRTQLMREGDRLVLFRSDLSSTEGNQMISVATIGVLVALLLPAVQAAREAARRNHSANNMKRIILGLINYEAARREFPAWASFDKDGKPLLSWRVHILPFIEMPELYARFRLDEPWDSEHNSQLIPLMPECFLDPSSRLTLAEGKTHYLGVKGEGYFFPEKAPLTIRYLQGKGDGAINTVAIVQVNDEQATTWTKPGDWEPDPKDPLKGLGGLHPGVFLAAFCAGQVRFIPQTINPDTWKALLTTHGKERVNQDDF